MVWLNSLQRDVNFCADATVFVPRLRNQLQKKKTRNPWKKRMLQFSRTAPSILSLGIIDRLWSHISGFVVLHLFIIRSIIRLGKTDTVLDWQRWLSVASSVIRVGLSVPTCYFIYSNLNKLESYSGHKCSAALSSLQGLFIQLTVLFSSGRVSFLGIYMDQHRHFHWLSCFSTKDGDNTSYPN